MLPAAQWESAVAKGVLRLLRQTTAAVERDWFHLKPQVILNPCPYRPSPEGLAIRSYSDGRWFDDSVDHLERAYPGARLFLFSQMDAAESVTPIFGPWRTFEGISNQLWYGTTTTEEFLLESNLVEACDEPPRAGETLPEYADRLNLFTPGMYARSVPADLLPPWAIKDLMQEIDRPTEAIRPAWLHTAEGRAEFGAQLIRLANLRHDHAAAEIFGSFGKLTEIDRPGPWQLDGEPSPCQNGAVMVHEGQLAFADHWFLYESEMGHEEAAVFIGTQDMPADAMLAAAGEYIDRLAVIDTALRTLAHGARSLGVESAISGGGME